MQEWDVGDSNQDTIFKERQSMVGIHFFRGSRLVDTLSLNDFLTKKDGRLKTIQMLPEACTRIESSSSRVDVQLCSCSCVALMFVDWLKRMVVVESVGVITTKEVQSSSQDGTSHSAAATAACSSSNSLPSEGERCIKWSIRFQRSCRCGC